MFVYSGILQVARTQAGLAAVLSHEVAHCLAQHHAERMSATLGTNIILYSLIFLTAPLPGAFFIIQALGGQFLDALFTRPMSRKMESEADYIGLMLMAEACYDPREALQFWERMEHISRSGGSRVVPEWMSTHPSVCTKLRLHSPKKGYTDYSLRSESKQNRDDKGVDATGDEEVAI